MPATRWLAIMVAGTVLAAIGPPALAQYQWRDKSGQLHAGDMPPPADVPDKDILKRPGGGAGRRTAAPPASAPAASAVAASAPRLVDPELEARRVRAEQEKAARAKADEERAAAQRAENCQRARAQLAMLDSGQRIARVNELGERIILDDQARADEAAAARRVAATDCR